MDDVVVLDTRMHGREGITGAFVVRGARTALVEAGPKSSVEHVLAGLDAAGVEELDWIVVTHIHLDHAGAAGTLAGRFPSARVAVHPVGAPHLVDPTKLWSSASRIYGDAMERLSGCIDAIDEDRLLVLQDGDEVDLGGRTLRAVETPGHAGHHHAYLRSATGWLFTGDALGVRLNDVGVVRPATPPPEFNLPRAIESIETIRALEPAELCLTHFGLQDERVDTLCDRAIEALERWASWVRSARAESADVDEVAARVTERDRSFLREGLPPDAADRMEQTTSYRMNVAGYMRYLDKHEGAAS